MNPNLALVDARAKDLISGYMRTFKMSPKEITQLCIAFYFTIDYFSTCGKSIILLTKDKHNDLISANRPKTWNTAYGDLSIAIKNTPNHIYSWTISTTTMNIAIGLDSSEYSILDTQWTSSHGIYHCWHTSNGLITNQAESLNNSAFEKYYKYINEQYSQLITMELNCKDRTIRYAWNGKDYGVAFKNIDDGLNYRFIVCIQSNASVPLLNFAADSNTE